ncbi:MAG: hypothetical protein V4717_24340 [Bacteroidota bacterium]
MRHYCFMDAIAVSKSKELLTVVEAVPAPVATCFSLSLFVELFTTGVIIA